MSRKVFYVARDDDGKLWSFGHWPEWEWYEDAKTGFWTPDICDNGEGDKEPANFDDVFSFVKPGECCRVKVQTVDRRGEYV